MMMDLSAALTGRGVDNASTVVARYPAAVIERSIAHWDTKRGKVGPGLLVQMIQSGGPAETSKPASVHYCFECRAEYEPTNVRIRGRKVASAYCSKCAQAGYDAGRWQERFLYESAGAA